MTKNQIVAIREEPYRLFFILGSLWGILGVMLWPLFYGQLLNHYPLMAHSRVMIQGFAGAFVFGFLGTALPKMMDTPSLSRGSVIGLLVIHSSCAILHLCGKIKLGDLCFLGTLILLTAVLIHRGLLPHRDKLPASWLLALCGLVCAFIGSALPVWFNYQLTGHSLELSNLLLYQGFLLYPFLGIGNYLLPRLLRLETKDASALSLTKAILYAVGIAISFLLEAYHFPLYGLGLRFAIFLTFLKMSLFKESSSKPRGTLGNAIIWPLILTTVTFLILPWYQAQKVAVSHLLYIGGFGMLILIVASRVVLGHAGEMDRFHHISKSLRWWVFLMVLATFTRITPAWVPSTTLSHHIYAAISWACVIGWWLCQHRHRFFKLDDT